MKTPAEIFDTMYRSDHFSQWLGVELVAIADGYCQLRMTVRTNMLNGFGMLHGGVSFSLADSAFAFASNTQGRISVSIDTHISHTTAAKVGDVLTATATQLYTTHKLGVYQVQVCNQHQQTVAWFKGTVFRTEKNIE